MESPLKKEVKEPIRLGEEAESGKKARGKKPAPPEARANPKDQVNLTDKESRIMPTSVGEFEHCDNAQSGVGVEIHRIVAYHVSQHPNDKQEMQPALDQIAILPRSGRNTICF